MAVGDWLGKIPSLFVRDSFGKALPKIDPACQWVEQGAHATKMYDGIGYLIGTETEFPLDPDDHDPDALEAALRQGESFFRPWPYELCGPGIKSNQEQQPYPILIPHSSFHYYKLSGIAPTYDVLRTFLAGRNTKGIVFWEDPWDYTCRKAKVTQADFGFRRNLKGNLD
jgi:hypothetical protein